MFDQPAGPRQPRMKLTLRFRWPKSTCSRWDVCVSAPSANSSCRGWRNPDAQRHARGHHRGGALSRCADRRARGRINSTQIQRRSVCPLLMMRSGMGGLRLENFPALPKRASFRFGRHEVGGRAVRPRRPRAAFQPLGRRRGLRRKGGSWRGGSLRRRPGATGRARSCFRAHRR